MAQRQARVRCRVTAAERWGVPALRYHESARVQRAPLLSNERRLNHHSRAASEAVVAGNYGS
eukprot:1306008-Alexandrium_andersonii.AAC.1